MVSAAIVESGEPFFNVEIADEELAYATRKPSVLSEEEPLSLAHPGKRFDEPWQKYFEAACGRVSVEPLSIDESELSRKMWDRSARRTWAVIRETAAPRVLKDELYADRRALVVSFELPPASYATLAIKRLQHAAR
jgi:tRNA(Glu) U13 pseudouridine synthase TruD